MASYSVYPIWGKDKPRYGLNLNQPFIIGVSKETSDIKNCRQFMRESRSSALIVDWKSRRYKMFIHGYEYIWNRFCMNDWNSKFRFTTPCEDWEITSSGSISDACQLRHIGGGFFACG